MGRAPAGMNWHHIVEQTPANVAQFGPEAIHNTQNLVLLDAMTHTRISAFYSSIQPLVTGSSGLRVREWLSMQPFESQRVFGEQILRDFEGM
jgi:hypothetical protein